MNEERENAYYELINTLLACPSGEEQEILNAQPNLLDAGLVETMLQVAAQLIVQGNLETSNQLMNVAGQILGVYVNTPLQKTYGNSSSWKQLEADQLIKQGFEAFQGGKLQAALLLWEQALAIYLSIQNRQGEVQSLIKMGIAYYFLGDYNQAIEYGQQGLAIAREIDDSHSEGQALNNLGLAYSDLGDYSKAIEYYQQSLVIKQTIQDRLGEENSLRNLGNAYSSLGDYNQAIEYHQQSLSIARQIGNRHGEGQALGNLGDIYEKLGNYSKAIELHQRSLIIMQELGNRLGEGTSLANLGSAYYDLGNYNQVIEYHQKSVAIAREMGHRNGEGISLGAIGNAFRALGNYDIAIEYHQQSLIIAQEIKSRELEADALRCLGNAYDALGYYNKAIKYHLQSLTIAQEIGNREAEATALGSLGLAYDILGSYAQAIDYHRQYLLIAREIGLRGEEANALSHLGWAYNALGDYIRAIKYHQQSLEIAREIGNRSAEETALANLGLNYDALGDDSKAIELHCQSLEIAREIGDRRGEEEALGNIGLIYYSRGDYIQAIDYYEQARAIAQEIKDRRGEGMSLNNIGLAYDAFGNYTKAIEYFQQSLAIAQNTQDKREQWASLNNLGYIFLRSGNLIAAEQALNTAMKICESLRTSLGSRDSEKVSIFETQIGTYQLLQLVLTTQNKTDAALEIAERGRARAFVELFATRLSDDQAQITPLTLKQIQHIAQQQNSTLVEYSIIDAGKLLIWVIKPNGEIAYYQIELEPLEQQNTSLSDLIIQSRESLGLEAHLHSAKTTTIPDIQQTVKHISQPLRQLHQLLIEPIAEHLPTNPNAHVIFIPQGALFLVPFPALQDAEGKFLIEKHTIVTAPSIQVLELTQKRSRETRETSPEALVVGNPKMPIIPLSEPPVQLQDLAWAKTEVNAIAPLLNTQAITGADATKVYIKEQMPKARLIHLATHGLLDDIRQLGVPGAIALAPSEEDNGFLTAGEILEMKLNAQLVVLSACSTGQGKITGDGVIGLSRSLIAAGVNSVIVSLWSVGDQSTAFLMVKFYQNLQQGMEVAVALNEAQRWLLGITKLEMEAWVQANQDVLSPTLRINLHRQLNKLSPDDQPFQNPQHWAAFCAIGQ